MDTSCSRTSGGHVTVLPATGRCLGSARLTNDRASSPGSSSGILPYEQHVATRWGEIQAYALLRGRPRPADDSWIAACCLARELPLATFSIKDYADFAEHEGLELVH